PLKPVRNRNQNVIDVGRAGNRRNIVVSLMQPRVSHIKTQVRSQPTFKRYGSGNQMSIRRGGQQPKSRIQRVVGAQTYCRAWAQLAANGGIAIQRLHSAGQTSPPADAPGSVDRKASALSSPAEAATNRRRPLSHWRLPYP